MAGRREGRLASCRVNWEGLQLKKKNYLMCEVPNIVFQRAHPAKSNIPREADFKKNSTLVPPIWAPGSPRPRRPEAGSQVPPPPPPPGRPAPGSCGKLAAAAKPGARGEGWQVRGAGRETGSPCESLLRPSCPLPTTPLA